MKEGVPQAVRAPERLRAVGGVYQMHKIVCFGLNHLTHILTTYLCTQSISAS